ncbi:MAG TPA: hypothetical protein VFB38_23025 [Chthonomonadaceae bacterium]|nr:hypothetical protein [Chthonomonadaceae bacterium]
MSTTILAAPQTFAERRSLKQKPYSQGEMPLPGEGRRGCRPPVQEEALSSRSHRRGAPPDAALPAQTALTARKLQADGPGAFRARYGPRSAPLFYTALREAPTRLSWESPPMDTACRVTLEMAEADGRFAPLAVTTLASDTHSLPLTGLPLRPGAVYAWRVEPAVRVEGAAETEGGWWQEGRFWLLEPEMLERLDRGRQLFAETPDPDFRAIALALLMAEVGLYHEALLQIRNGPAREERPARQALSHTTQALIYRQVAQRLEQEQARGGPAGGPPACFHAWASAREEYYRQKVMAQSERGLSPESLAQLAPEKPREAARNPLSSMRRAA